MSERGAYELPDGTLVRTQGEIPKGVSASKVMIPVDSQGLIDHINSIIRRERAQVATATPPSAPEKSAEQLEEEAAVAARRPQMSDEQRERFEALARRMGWSPPGAKAPAPVAAPPPPPVETDAVEQIMNAEGKPLLRMVEAAIGRFGEVAGVHGWAAFTKDVYSWTPSARAIEQGMGMLTLAAFSKMGMVAAPTEPVSDDAAS